MEVLITGCLVVMVLCTMFALHFVEMSISMRSNDAEGVLEGPAFVEFTKGFICACVAIIACAVMLAVLGWYAIALDLSFGAGMFFHVLTRNADTPMSYGHRVSFFISLMIMLSAIAGALGRGLS